MSREALAREVEKDSRGGRTVLVIGGSGGMSDRYRDVAEKHGLTLKHYETRVPKGVRRDVGKVALVIIMVTMVSHALRDQVHNLGISDAPVVYLRSASVSALRGALEQWEA
ncbi:DUF2325 domain-containing protein [Polyangium mundeleinium]|uniref:DUF2325 domain-containing protein n=1 Tax=Polyangium mundeleinium TaxID=2995306 RepID=A0ABT5EQC7_9BACT|nr:DUF2325 domain-containing protein [Polyangium mundeleinium]MDC0744035.1 DUF2325 domain-containing protein [Polyangium mundeleinium]